MACDTGPVVSALLVSSRASVFEDGVIAVVSIMASEVCPTAEVVIVSLLS